MRTFRADGADTSAAIYGGVSPDQGVSYTESYSVVEDIGIYVSLNPEFEDIGLAARIVVVERSDENHVQITPNGVVPLEVTSIEETEPRLIPFSELTLTERVDLSLLDFLGGTLSPSAAELGKHEIFIGYTTDNTGSGIPVFTYNDQAIELVIQE